MNFVNEYASDEDAKNYKLNDIWDRYNPIYKGEYFFGNQPRWTVDREKNIFLMLLGGGRGEHGNRSKFLLWWDSEHVVVSLDLADGSSGNLDSDPFFRVWDMAFLEIPGHLKNKQKEVIDILKEALRVYGYRGVSKQRPNTIVKFNF